MIALPNDTIKPSRINRKLKRRWKKSVKISDLVKSGLTDCYRVVNLIPVAHNGGTELAFRYVAAQPQTCGFFVRKISVSHIMMDWAEHSQEWPGATPVRQLCSVCHQMIGVVWRQVYNLIRVAIMNTSTPSSAHNSGQTTISTTNADFALVNHQPKTIVDLHQAFTELCLSYGTLGRNISAERNNEALSNIIDDCKALSNIAGQVAGGVK